MKAIFKPLKVLTPLIEQFLPYAEVTAELRKHVLALDFYQSYRDNYPTAVEYLTVINSLVSVGFSIKNQFLSNIMAQDFGDDGEVYQSQLNRITRYFIFDYPLNDYRQEAIIHLQKSHNISEILDQIEVENATTLDLQQTRKTGGPSTAFDLSQTSHVSSGKGVGESILGADIETVASLNKAEEAAHNFEVQDTPCRILKRKREYETMASKQLTTDVDTHQQEWGRAKKKRRYSIP